MWKNSRLLPKVIPTYLQTSNISTYSVFPDIQTIPKIFNTSPNIAYLQKFTFTRFLDIPVSEDLRVSFSINKVYGLNEYLKGNGFELTENNELENIFISFVSSYYSGDVLPLIVISNSLEDLIFECSYVLTNTTRQSDIAPYINNSLPIQSITIQNSSFLNSQPVTSEQLKNTELEVNNVITIKYKYSSNSNIFPLADFVVNKQIYKANIISDIEQLTIGNSLLENESFIFFNNNLFKYSYDFKEAKEGYFYTENNFLYLLESI